MPGLVPGVVPGLVSGMVPGVVPTATHRLSYAIPMPYIPSPPRFNL